MGERLRRASALERTGMRVLEPLPWGRLIFVWVVFGISVVVSWRGYDVLPQRFPMHWTLLEGPDRFSVKSPGAVFTMGCLVPLLLAIASTVVVGQARYSVHQPGGEPDHGDALKFNLRVARANRRQGLYGSYFASLSAGVSSVLMLRMFDVWHPGPLGIILVAAIAVPTTWLVFCLIKWNARRIRPRPGEKAQRVVAGMLYYNRADPRALAALGDDTTAVNLARPGGWGILVGLAVPIVVAVVVLVSA